MNFLLDAAGQPAKFLNGGYQLRETVPYQE
jgi:hypothetical protein